MAVKNPKMTREEILHDFNLVRKMIAPDSTKAQILKQIFKHYPDRWRVIGITENAINLLKDADFIYTIGLQRAHLKDCYKTYPELMKRDFKNGEDLYKAYYLNDETILATKSENSKNGLPTKYIRINENLNLFNDIGYKWKHDNDEIEHLKQLYEIRDKKSVDRLCE